MDYATGFDPDLSLFELLKDNGYIKGAGAYLYFDGYDDMKFARLRFKEKLQSDPAFMDAYIKVSLDCLEKSISTNAVADVVPINSATAMLNVMRSQMSA